MKVTTSTAAPRSDLEQLLELDEAPALQPAQHDAHVLAHAELLAADRVVLRQPGAPHQVRPGGAQFGGVDVGQARRQRLLDVHLRAQEVAAVHRQRVEPCCGQLDLLVLDQPAHQLGARILGLAAVGRCFGGSSMRDLISISIAAISR